MLERNTDKDWKRYGQEGPYYGVVSHDRFHKGNLTPEGKHDFFRTGEVHADYLLSQIRTHMVPDFSPHRVLDFGCGVGRCTLPLARCADSALGVDVSEAMIEEARRNAGEFRMANVSFAVSDATLSSVEGPFDLIHSFIVFQHIPPRRGEPLIHRMIDLLSAEGVAVLHFLYYADLKPHQSAARWLRKHAAPLHWLANGVYGKPLRYPLMEKNVYDLNRLFRLLRRRGCGQALVRFEGLQSMHGILLFFRKHADVVPYNLASGGA